MTDRDRPSAAGSFLPLFLGFAASVATPFAVCMIVRPEHLLPSDTVSGGFAMLGRVALVLQALPALLWSGAAMILVELFRRRVPAWHGPVIAGIIASYLLFLPFSFGSWYLGMGVLEWEAATPAGVGCGNPFFGWLVLQLSSVSLLPIGFLGGLGAAVAWRKLSRPTRP